MTIIGLLPGLLAAGAEAKQYELLRPLNQVTAGETITVGADFIKPQHDRYVIRLVLVNEATDRALLVRMDELQCSWGGARATLKHSAFGIGERSMDLRPGEAKAFTMSCLTGPSTGDFRVDLLRVYDDSVGDILFEGVTWSITEAGIQRKANKSIPAGFVPKVTDHPKPPPPGAPPSEPEGIVNEVVTKSVEIADKVVHEIKEEIEEHRDPPAEQPE